MNQAVIMESYSLRNILCVEENLGILERIGSLVMLPGTGWATRENVARFYEVPSKTITTVVIRHGPELN